MKFKVGDKVRVKQEEDIDTSGSPGWTSWMDRMSGKEYILDQKSGNCWKLPDQDDDLSFFKEEWLEKIEETPKFKVGDKVQIKSESDIEQDRYLTSDDLNREESVHYRAANALKVGTLEEIDEDGDYFVRFKNSSFHYAHPSWVIPAPSKKTALASTLKSLGGTS